MAAQCDAERETEESQKGPLPRHLGRKRHSLTSSCRPLSVRDLSRQLILTATVRGGYCYQIHSSSSHFPRSRDSSALELTILYHSVSHSYLPFCKPCGIIPLEMAADLYKQNLGRRGSKHQLSKRLHPADEEKSRK